jgi:hypothetical protein
MTESTTQYEIRWNDSIHEFVNAAVKRADKTGASHNDGDWSGTDTFAQSVDYAKQGTWEPGDVSEFRNMFDELIPKLREYTDQGFEVRADTAGFEVDMQAYLDGEPENMRQYVPIEEAVTKRALCMVRALRLLGYELEIWSEMTVKGRQSQVPYSVLTCLHKAGQVMDESAVEFAVGNPSWLRRLIFGYEEGEPPMLRKRYGFVSSGGYGAPVGIHHKDLVGADVALDLGRGWWRDGGNTGQRAMEWVVAQLKELGVLDSEAVIEFD